jgi:hypothetical protein
MLRNITLNNSLTKVFTRFSFEKINLGKLNLEKLNYKKILPRIINLQVIWYAASLIAYGWFLSWIASDIFVWQKPLNHINMTNYIGAITSIVLIWIGNIIFNNQTKSLFERFKIAIPKIVNKKPEKEETSNNTSQKQPETETHKETHEERKGKTKKKPHKTRINQTNRTQLAETQLQQLPIPQTPAPPPEPTQLLPQTQTNTTQPKCQHHIKNSLDIPDTCLTCTELIQCLSKPKN